MMDFDKIAQDLEVEFKARLEPHGLKVAVAYDFEFEWIEAVFRKPLPEDRELNYRLTINPITVTDCIVPLKDQAVTHADNVLERFKDWEASYDAKRRKRCN